LEGDDMGDLSKDFNRREFACKCGCGFDRPSERLVNLIQRVRDKVGQPLTLVSGCRCTKHNKNVGSKVLGKAPVVRGGVGDETASAHTRGEAADIRVKGMSKLQLYKLLTEMYGRGEIPELEYLYMIRNSHANLHVGVDKKARNSRFGGEQ
jgi:uncharacterized protein YcbK (DUF882 family)